MALAVGAHTQLSDSDGKLPQPMRVDEQLLRREQLGLRRVAEVVIRDRKLLCTHAPHKYSRTTGMRTRPLPALSAQSRRCLKWPLARIDLDCM